MKKAGKFLLGLGLASTMVLSGGLFVACGASNNEGENTDQNTSISIQDVKNAVEETKTYFSKEYSEVADEAVESDNESISTINAKIDITAAFESSIETDIQEESFNQLSGFATSTVGSLNYFFVQDLNESQIYHYSAPVEDENQTVDRYFKFIKTSEQTMTFDVYGYDMNVVYGNSSQSWHFNIDLGVEGFEYVIDAIGAIDFVNGNSQIMYFQIAKENKLENPNRFAYTNTALKGNLQSNLEKTLVVNDIDTIYEGGVFDFKTLKGKSGDKEMCIAAVNIVKSSFADNSELKDSQNLINITLDLSKLN